ncbi:BRO-N domain-containing protein [Paraburkholderia bannensis]|uniref:BRO-N domain-containing protein n=1 Tax=Paraburkholderia bannensis TaxID=765414 RepID=UPI0005AAB5A1|nr:Bro-N domain-containing protein [Paraburkholderia bannensis]
MSRIIPFSFENHEVRIVADDTGAPWFCANDVCAVLEYSNARDAIAKHVDPDDVAKRDTIDSLGRPQQTNHINESGLYALILGSTKEEAKRFKRWVTAEVLPTIRKTGSFGKPSAISQTIDATKLFQPCFRIARLIGCDKQAAAISANQAVQSLTGTNVLGLLGQTHLVAENQESLYYTPTELGKRVSTSARSMNLRLAAAGFQVKKSEHWEMTDAGRRYGRIYDAGKKQGSGVPIQQIKWSVEVIPALGIDAA